MHRGLEDCVQFIQLKQYAQTLASLRTLFEADSQRFECFSFEAAGIFVDYSKNRVDKCAFDGLINLAKERGVPAMRLAMFSGEKINQSEARSVLHTALRAPQNKVLKTGGGQDIALDVETVLEQMKFFSDEIRNGGWRGFSGAAITDVVNIGIGGSDLGPRMVCEALSHLKLHGLNVHFVANVDGEDLGRVLSQIKPETTLFIIASKTFTTQETMMNARSARAWFLRKGKESDLKHHFVAISANQKAVVDFGIDTKQMFPFWDWVGGRYSLWSAIGLSISIALGFGHFADLLSGAHEMDEHFRTAPLNVNLPVILAMIGIWNRNVLGLQSLSLAIYHEPLRYFPNYLQQLDMESNGKRVGVDGQLLKVATGPLVWGSCGTNAQHAYFQWLHQGSDVAAVDFIACLASHHDLPGHQAMLLANCFAQSEAFMLGKTAQQVEAEFRVQGADEMQIAALTPYKVFSGNRPSNTILLDRMTPATLGALIALYEHKIFVQGVVWGINSFDQWGVELGKQLAEPIHSALSSGLAVGSHDSSTLGLIARAHHALQQS